MATGIGDSSSPASASIAVNSANPATESAMRRLATRFPPASTKATS